jgi:hypothetical protein
VRFARRLADHLAGGFVEFDHVEGLVLKRLGSTLSNMAREGLDGRWQLKVRKPSSKYRF